MPPQTLPSNLFNPPFYTRILRLWFSTPNTPSFRPTATSPSAPTPAQTARWFALGSAAENQAFDTECASLALPALQSIDAEKYPLPPFPAIAAEDRAQNYETIASPFMREITTTSSTTAATVTETASPAEEKDPSINLSPQEKALALLLLLDQLPRNIFRGPAASVVYTHYDRLARAVAYATYNLHLDLSSPQSPSTLSPSHQTSSSLSPLPLPYLSWLYLPLMHSELLSDHSLYAHKLSEAREQMAEKGDEEGVGYAEMCLGFGKRHQELVERFGRYPHRNACLEREGTEEEREFLAGGGERFGS